MKNKITCFNLIIILAAAICSGCTTVEYTDRKQLMFYDETSDISAGEAAWKEIIKTQKVDDSSIYGVPLNRVGSRIAKVANKPNYQWTFKVFDSTEANAFALPGGKVAFYAPIFAYFANDAELATVAGHEIGHVLARHGMEGQSRSQVQALGALPLYVLFDSAEADAAVDVYTKLSTVGAMLPYSRLQEYEADRIGMILMAKAGYNPNAAIIFWQKFGANDQTSYLAAFFSTHPRGKERIDEMRKNLPEAMQYYQSAVSKLNYGSPMPKKK